ncbi:MAG TPA: hypothetical protein PK040_00495 [Anaerolineaceae bacterium]|nr:hypothetical protein [Anaerolineaceae bacterium]
MPGKKEDLRNAKTDPDPDLNFSYNELLDELTRELTFEERKPGDVTAGELMETTGMTRSWVNELLARKVRAGELVRVKVRLPGTRSGWTYAYRRKE